ncbi:helix-turn-helix domain-containing protein [Actinomadura xylanilytica]|uniref:helix-turn-helix domain-containing protein n=1 Tax=Actinomadura xylanilytica TaxID=887459 RepID=UPI00255A7AFF|nr:helix-turn-helix transcriptional regulator [Actinomadura xylanilytica]MDL4770728.1 helix-turn-helix transcriptional regulator [Actinomadura xylanilytica]
MLARLRADSGLTREQVADYVGIGAVTITRIESCKTPAKPADVAMMGKLYELGEEETEALVALARQARKRGWWQQYGDAFPAWFEVYVGLEEEASKIRSWQPELVPGLLQSPGYARALILAEPEVPVEEEIERRLAVRAKRQDLLSAVDAPQMHVVVSEGALRQKIGGPEVMREQLRRLGAACDQDSMAIQVLPFDAGAHPAMQSGFHLLSFVEPDPTVAHIAYRTGGLYLEQPSEVDVYEDLFDRLCAKALDAEASRTLIERIAAEMS